VGIASTIAVARQAREQLKVALQACETSTDAANRAIGILSATDDTDGPLVSSKEAATAWRDELETVGRELGRVADELDRFATELEAIHHRIQTPAPAAPAAPAK
jgi:DNA repair ATPase RecN